MHILHCTNCALYHTHITHSDGCYLYDEGGAAYADLDAGVWCASLGHNHAGTNRALAAQMGRLGHTGYHYTAPVVEEAAALLLAHVGMPGGKCVFLSSGSEAVELAVQAARRLVPRGRILCLDGYFLSSYGAAANRPEAEWMPLPVDGVHTDAQARALMDTIPFGQIGVFVFEPGNASGLVRPPFPGLVSQIAQAVQANGGLVVADEVTTGIGRTGAWFGFEHYGLAPDLVACGKGLGNGYPVSAVALRGGLADALLAGGFHYAQSHQNDPAGCAVALAVLQHIEQHALIRQAAETGAFFRRGLERLAAACRCIREVRGVGLMLAVEFHGHCHDRLPKLHRALFDQGFLVGYKPAADTFRFYPPLIVERELIERFLHAFGQLVAALG